MTTHSSTARMVPVTRIHAHPGNIRDDVGDVTELAASIRVHGILQPLVVETHPEIPGVYQLLAGHRRLAGAKRAGLQQVPVIIRAGEPAAAPEELMLVENCQRRDLGPMEKAEAMGALIKRGHTASHIAHRIGMAPGTVSYYLSLLDLTPDAQEQVRAGHLSAASAVGAVRQARAQQRKKQGKPAMGAQWEPDHFTSTHALARRAAALCAAREHSMRRQIGKVACGQCWETVIRQDERVATETLQGTS